MDDAVTVLFPREAWDVIRKEKGHSTKLAQAIECGEEIAAIRNEDLELLVTTQGRRASEWFSQFVIDCDEGQTDVSRLPTDPRELLQCVANCESVMEGAKKLARLLSFQYVRTMVERARTTIGKARAKKGDPKLN